MAFEVAGDLDIAWAAGIYEGEGTVNVPRAGSRYLRVSVTQKDSWLCEKLRELFGGFVYTYGYGPTHSRAGRRYNYWRLNGTDAKEFLEAIYPYLSPRRRDRVDLALAGRRDYTHPTRGRRKAVA